MKPVLPALAILLTYWTASIQAFISTGAGRRVRLVASTPSSVVEAEDPNGGVPFTTEPSPPAALPLDPATTAHLPPPIMSFAPPRKKKVNTIQDSALFSLLHAQALQTAREADREAERRQRALLTTRLQMEAIQRRRKTWRYKVGLALGKLFLLGSSSSHGDGNHGWNTKRMIHQGRQSVARRLKSRWSLTGRQDRLDDNNSNNINSTNTNHLNVSSDNLKVYAAKLAVDQVEENLWRQRPRSSREEQALQQKYASIESISERAYAILSDLGMNI